MGDLVHQVAERPISAPAVSITHAERIVGMMPPKLIHFLADYALKCSNVVEIGCYRGRTTRALCDNCPGTVYAVDTWEGAPELMRDIDYMCTHTGDPEWLYHEFLHNTQDCENLVIRKMPSVVAAGLFPENFFDLIFIDAAHDYENVKADILAWVPRLKRGGLICGDDYYAPGVQRAVDEFFQLDQPTKDTRMWGVQTS